MGRSFASGPRHPSHPIPAPATCQRDGSRQPAGRPRFESHSFPRNSLAPPVQTFVAEMERMLVVVYGTEEKALEGAHALEAFDEGSLLALHAAAVVTRGLTGEIAVRITRRPVPQGTMGATAVGTMIGALGGAFGMAIGAAAGLALGALTDYQRARLDRGFVDDVSRSLERGKSALVAQIDEESPDGVDARMRAIGSEFIFRRPLGELADESYERTVESFNHIRGRIDGREHRQ